MAVTASDHAGAVETFKQYHRLRSTVEGLETLADALYPLAAEQVVITETTFEADNTTRGIIGIPAWVSLQAVLEVLAEKDPATAALLTREDSAAQVSFAGRQTVV